MSVAEKKKQSHKKLNRFLYPLFFALTILNVFFASWYVQHGDIAFPADIARDFHLLAEIDEKKLVLIGPRSSVAGLFHGPLWLYLNYPAYVIGGGSPVIVGWFWILLLIAFLVSSYFIAKKLFDQLTAWFFVLMASSYLVYHVNGMFNPHGAMLLLPAFFFFFVRYIQTLQVKYLIANVLIGGVLIQFQMAIGVPFLILSFLYVTFLSLKNHNWKHLFAFALILIPLSTFLLFDLRHDFILFKNVIRHLQTGDPTHGFAFFLEDRIRIMTEGMEFLRFGPAHGSFYALLIFAIFLFLQIKNRIHKQIYLLFLYFFLGFFLLSLLNKYAMLYFYVFPLFLLVFLIFASFATSKHKKIFLAVFFTIYVINLAGILHFVKESKNIIGKDEDSWKFLYEMSKQVYQGKEEELGYFVYSPDILGYEPKYAMFFAGKQSNKTAYSFEKQPITYLVIAPNPKNPYMNPAWWRKNQINIASDPVFVKTFENGYKIEKYELTQEELPVPFDPSINPGIHFR